LLGGSARKYPATDLRGIPGWVTCDFDVVETGPDHRMYGATLPAMTFNSSFVNGSL